MTTIVAIKLAAAVLALAGSVLGLVAWRRSRVAAAVGDDPNSVEGRGVVRWLVSPLAARLRPREQVEIEDVKTALLQAGRRSRDAVDRYFEERALWLVFGLAAAVINLGSVDGLFGLMLAVGAVLLGLYGAEIVVRLRAAERREAVAQALPGAVDLLTLCIEAGLSLEQALARVGRDLGLSAPTLADELRLVTSELAAGIPMAEALRRLARRVGLDDLSAMCGVLAQSYNLGAPVGKTLHEYATSTRRQRLNQLEERAGSIATRLSIPMAVCFLPASLLIILGPPAVQFARSLG
jgi:tight adherence protein C